MASGQQKAKRNLELFITWAATQVSDDFKQIIHRGQLSRTEIAKAVGCGKSALLQNPELRKELDILENRLRNEGVLPVQAKRSIDSISSPKEYDNQASRRIMESKRLSALELENIELKAKVTALENKLKRFGELSEVMAETGFIPR